MLNLPDCYENVLFDAAMDARTGYRSKQMLCVPSHDRPGNVAAVLQLVNTFDDKPFNEAGISR
jgi:hypothetical protein